MTTRTNLLSAIVLAFFCSCEIDTSRQSRINSGQPDGQQMAFIDELYQSFPVSIPNVGSLPELVVELENTNLIERKAVSEIPNLFLSFLQNKEPDFSLANPGEEWQEQIRLGCGSPVLLNVDEEAKTEPKKPLPTRQLVYFGLYDDIALMAYFTGGWSKSETIVIFKYTDTEIKEYWVGTTLDFALNKETILLYLRGLNGMN